MREEHENRKKLFEEHLKRVRDNIAAGFEQVKAESAHDPLDDDGIRYFTEKIRYMLNSMVDPFDSEHIKFSVDRDPNKIAQGYINLEPGNLFTLLLFRGHYVPAAMLGTRDQYLCDDGVTYGFKDGKSYFTPPTPLESITVDLTITPDDLELKNEEPKGIKIEDDMKITCDGSFIIRKKEDGFYIFPQTSCFIVN